MMIRPLVAFLLLAPIYASAQDTDYQHSADALAQQLKTPVSAWDSTTMTNYVKALMTQNTEILWSPQVKPAIHLYLTDSPPRIETGTDGSLRSAYERNDTIVFPNEFASYLINVGMFISHDAWVRHNSIPFLGELVSTPYRDSQIVPLLSPLGKFMQPDQFYGMMEALGCMPNDKACLQNAALGLEGNLFFMLLHENAHQRLHHQNVNGNPSLQQELAADASALAAMKILSTLSVPDDIKDNVVWMFKGGPILWLAFDCTRDGVDQTICKARLEQALTLLGDDRDEFEQYITPEHKVHSLTHLRLKSDRPYTLYLIDGVRFDPAEIPADGIIATTEHHTFIGINPDGIGVGGGYPIVTLIFHPFENADSDTLNARLKVRDWAGVLAGSSNSQLLLRDPADAWSYASALHALDAVQCIQLAPNAALSNEQSSRVRVWRKASEPLDRWRYDIE